MNLSSRQKLAIAVIVATGLAGSAAVLLANRRSPAAERNETAAAAHPDAAPAVRLTPAAARAAGIVVVAAGPVTLESSADFPGEVQFNQDRTAHVVARLAGVAEGVPATLGQVVRKGDVLAVIASTGLSDQRSELLTARKRRELARTTYAREKKLWEERISAEQDFQQATGALQEADIAVANAAQKLAAVGATAGSSALNRLEIRAPFDGTIVEKHLALGEAVAADARLFTLADLRTVWVEFVVAPRDVAGVRVGQQVDVSSSATDAKAAGTVSYVGALLGEQTRTAKARVTLDNADATWRPGLFVTVSVRRDPRRVPVGVRHEALQTIDDRPHVFVVTSEGFVARPVKTGRADRASVEIVEGLAAGEQVAIGDTIVLKSEVGKADADHGH